jgi:predicted amidohydrolase YtcJ
MTALKDPSSLTARTVRRSAAAAATLVAMLAIGACSKPSRDTDSPAVTGPDTKVYAGGDILTMVGRQPAYVEALAVRDGKILAVGTRDEVVKAAGDNATLVDLAGKTLLPGFIDTHGHMVYFGKNLMDANLVGSADIPEIVARLKKHAEMVPEGAWIVGFGYKAAALAEKRTPTAADLDQVSATRPLLIVDSSGHLGSANSALLKLAGVTAATPDPEGGNFTRKSGSKEPLGPMEETALNAVRAQRPAFTGELANRAMKAGAAEWAKHGQTTAQDCGLGLGNDDIDLVLNAIDKNLLPIDLYVCAKDSITDQVLDAAYGVSRAYGKEEGGLAQRLLAKRPDLDKRYINRVRMGGVKYWLDGSLDTAWFTQPYTTNPPGKNGIYSGFQQVPDEVLDAAFERFWTSDVQINMHMNGDAAVEQALRAIEKAIAKHGMRDHRPVFIHATYMRPDQIERMKTVGAIPTYLSAGIVTAGDGVLKMWGAERANHSAAANTVEKMGQPWSLSHDAPVTPSPSILALVDAAVNRRTASGTIIGPDERVSPYAALGAVTRSAAYQIKEEKTKGTLEVGKLADMVLLSANPLKVDPATIKEIQVLVTYKEGIPVFDQRREVYKAMMSEEAKP